MTQIRSVTIKGFRSFRDATRINFGALTVLMGPNDVGKTSAIEAFLGITSIPRWPLDPSGVFWDGGKEYEVEIETSDSNLACRLAFGLKETGDSVKPIMLSPTRSDWKYGPNKWLSVTPQARQEEIWRELTENGLHKKWGIDSPQVVCYRNAFLVPGIGNEMTPWKQIEDILLHCFALYRHPDWVTSVSKLEVFLRRAPQQIAGDFSRLCGKRIAEIGVEVAPNRRTRAAYLVYQEEGGKRYLPDFVSGLRRALLIVAALRANDGMVYVEHPEMGLSRFVQFALGELIADAASRGVQVVVETHSDIILLAIQKAIAEGRLGPENVQLHWFERDKDGATYIDTAILDEEGTYGDWRGGEDASLDAMDAYLEAVSRRRERLKERGV